MIPTSHTRRESMEDLDDGLVQEEHLPMRAELLPAAPDHTQLYRINEVNEKILKIIDYTDEHHEFSERSADFHILDVKLSLVLDILIEILTKQSHFPTKHWVKLSSHSIAWHSDEKPAWDPGSHIIVSVYLHHGVPRSLLLPGKMAETKLTEDGKHWETVVRFTGLTENVTSLIEKAIFRHHRRSIAFNRQAAKRG